MKRAKLSATKPKGSLQNMRFLVAIVLTVVAAATATSIFYLRPHADTPTTASFQAEAGTKTGVTTISDTTAAGGSAIRFGAVNNSGSGEPAPTGNLPGWTHKFTQDFNTNATLGQFRAVYGAAWDGYNGYEDTSRNLGRPAGQRGLYSASKTVTVQNSILDVYVHTEGVQPYVFALTPPDTRQLYGRYAVRFRSDLVQGYKVAWLLWPDSEDWVEGEIDFPEADLGTNINGFSHDITGNPRINAWVVNTNTSMQQWHTAVIEWTPTVLRFKLDNQTWQTTNPKAIPTKSMHWVLQTETHLSSTPPPVSAAGHVQIDWVAGWAYSP